MRTCLSRVVLPALVAVLAAGLGAQQPAVDWPTVAKIREEGLQRSQVMDLESYMTDVLGARLTLSEDMKRAQAWALAEMGRIGLVNVAAEPYMDYGVSWDNEAEIQSKADLTALTGRLAGAVVLVSPPIVAVTPEHYNRLYRVLQRGVPARVDIEVRNRIGERVEQAVNLIGEIPGTDLKDEIVMASYAYHAAMHDTRVPRKTRK